MDKCDTTSQLRAASVSAQTQQSASPAIAVVVPVFDDWEYFARLLGELDAVAGGLSAPVTVVAVDDGSVAGSATGLEAGL